MTSQKEIKVFIASPGDLSPERRAFKTVIAELNIGFGDGANVKFVALGWEDTLAITGRRNQSIINRDIEACDVFILAMHRRWGQDAPDSDFSSYTEEEFHFALARWQQTGLPEIFVFFKDIDPGQMADPGPQLELVLKFRKSLEDSRQLLYKSFGDVNEFVLEVDRHLRAYAKGEISQVENRKDLVVFPLDAIEAIRRAKADATEALNRAQKEQENAHAAIAQAKLLALALAEQAARAATEGRIEEARQLFAKVQHGSVDQHVLSLAFSFYRRIGDLGTAMEMAERSLAIAGPNTPSKETASAHCKKAIVYLGLGKLLEAEESLKLSLKVCDLIESDVELAHSYAALGLLFHARGNLDQADVTLHLALDVYTKLGLEEQRAIVLGNLGLVAQTRPDIVTADALYKESLRLHERFGNIEGIANCCGNLGLLEAEREQLTVAEDYLQRALALSIIIGSKEGIGNSKGNLAVLYKKRGQYEQAEREFNEALIIHEEIGNLEGVASSHVNIGLMAGVNGDVKRALDCLENGLSMYRSMGMEAMVTKTYSILQVLRTLAANASQSADSSDP